MLRWVQRLMLPLALISLALCTAESLPRSLVTAARKPDLRLWLWPVFDGWLRPVAAWAAPSSQTPQPRLITELNDLATMFEQGSGALTPSERRAARAGFPLEVIRQSVRDALRSRLMRIDSAGRVQVYIRLEEVNGPNLAALEDASVGIEIADRDHHLVQAWVPATRLIHVAGLPFVRLVRLPSYAFRQTGSVDTEGDAILKADQVRSQLGVTGKGVRVGVISDGIRGVFATGCTTCQGAPGGPISTGDLPASTGTRDASGYLIAVSGGITAKPFATDSNPNGDLENPVPGCSFTGAGAEGTALMEIVYDIAPNAALSFSNANTSLEFGRAVNYLAATNDVVVDDLGFYGEPYDGSSDVSTNTANALNSPSKPIRAYITAVGNGARGHYQETYLDSGVDGSATTGESGDLHLFQATPNGNQTSDILGLGPGSYDEIDLKSGGEVVIFLTWNDPFGASANDYDLFLVDANTGKAVASSTNRQTGTQDPLEFISYTNETGNEGFFHILIQNVGNKAVPKILQMFVLTPECASSGPQRLNPPLHEIHNYNTVSHSVAAQADAGGTPVSVISVGAICSGSAASESARPTYESCQDPAHTTLEFFSGNGPTFDGRTKPDVTAIDGVSVTGAGSFENPFYGTSAAAPHAAGVAALLLQAAPCLLNGAIGARSNSDARAAVRSLLLLNATGLGPSPPNQAFGYGRIDALASARHTIPSASSVPASLTLAGNTASGATIQPADLAFSDPDECPLGLSYSGCGVPGSASSVHCPFGPSTLTVTATNGGTTSAQATVAVTVSNFLLSASPSSVTVAPGQAASYTVSATPEFGAYPSAVALACRNLPSQARCSFSAPSVTPGSATATAALTISTTAASSMFRLAPGRWPGPAGEILSAVLLTLVGLGLMLGRWAPGLRLGLGAVVSLGLLVLALSCGGGGTPPVSNPGTPAGVYTVTITGTNGSLVQSTTTTLVVQ